MGRNLGLFGFRCVGLFVGGVSNMRVVKSGKEATHEIRYVFQPTPLFPNRHEYWLLPLWLTGPRHSGKHVVWVQAEERENDRSIPEYIKRVFAGSL